MIEKIFLNNNTNKLSGQYVVEQLIPSFGLPEIAEETIKKAINNGILVQDGKYLILPDSQPESEPESEPESKDENAEIKKAWFQLRQIEKTNINPSKFKIYCESFVRQFGWNYFIFNPELRKKCEKLGYHSEPSERALFNKEVLQK